MRPLAVPPLSCSSTPSGVLFSNHTGLLLFPPGMFFIQGLSECPTACKGFPQVSKPISSPALLGDSLSYLSYNTVPNLFSYQEWDVVISKRILGGGTVSSQNQQINTKCPTHHVGPLHFSSFESKSSH